MVQKSHSQPPWDVSQTLVNNGINGINYQPQLVFSPVEIINSSSSHLPVHPSDAAWTPEMGTPLVAASNESKANAHLANLKRYLPSWKTWTKHWPIEEWKNTWIFFSKNSPKMLKLQLLQKKVREVESFEFGGNFRRHIQSIDRFTCFVCYCFGGLHLEILKASLKLGTHDLTAGRSSRQSTGILSKGQ